MSKVWNILPKLSDDLIEQLLINRGLTTNNANLHFFHPQIKDYSNDLQIPGINIAAERIMEAIKKGETIFVYGDYDVDGVVASATIYHGLRALGATILPYIPHREKEGYGLSRFGLEEIKSRKGKLIITVDQGIVAFEAAKVAKELELDLIITDHHTRLKEDPEALVIIHSDKMCGTAVAWSLIKTMVEKELSKKLLQFVALGTIADLIPLTGLNRALVVEGLKEINQTGNIGLKALILESGLNLGSIGAFEVGFTLGPRLNAIGRLEHAIDALRLLCTKDPLKAARLARLLCDTNLLRQKMTQTAIFEAKQQISELKKIFILDNQNWSPGIIGLVAARVCEEYLRPVIAISKGEKLSKGSARSVNGLNIVEAIRKASDLLIDIGGHAGAAGFTIETKKIEDFKQRLETHFSKMNFNEQFQTLEIEARVNAEDLSQELVEKIADFEPFGIGNPKPVLASLGLTVSDIKTVSEGKHLKLKLEGIEAIGFNMGERAAFLKVGQVVDCAYNLEINRFNGRETLQLKLKDLRQSCDDSL